MSAAPPYDALVEDSEWGGFGYGYGYRTMLRGRGEGERLGRALVEALEMLRSGETAASNVGDAWGRAPRAGIWEEQLNTE
jgi:hypothetical protein